MHRTFYVDQKTGEPLGPPTHQGRADESPWSRGQVWAVYSLALAAAWCAKRPFAEAGEQAAQRFMAELPPAGCCAWLA